MAFYPGPPYGPYGGPVAGPPPGVGWIPARPAYAGPPVFERHTHINTNPAEGLPRMFSSFDLRPSGSIPQPNSEEGTRLITTTKILPGGVGEDARVMLHIKSNPPQLVTFIVDQYFMERAGGNWVKLTKRRILPTHLKDGTRIPSSQYDGIKTGLVVTSSFETCIEALGLVLQQIHPRDSPVRRHFDKFSEEDISAATLVLYGHLSQEVLDVGKLTDERGKTWAARLGMGRSKQIELSDSLCAMGVAIQYGDQRLWGEAQAMLLHRCGINDDGEFCDGNGKELAGSWKVSMKVVKEMLKFLAALKETRLKMAKANIKPLPRNA